MEKTLALESNCEAYAAYFNGTFNNYPSVISVEFEDGSILWTKDRKFTYKGHSYTFNTELARHASESDLSTGEKGAL